VCVTMREIKKIAYIQGERNRKQVSLSACVHV
jgi:hypothetical protein